LAIDASRFRGDLKILSSSEKYRILAINQGIFYFLTSLFYKESDTIPKIVNAKKSSKLYARHLLAKRFYKHLIRLLCFFQKVDVVISPNYRYLQDYDFLIAAKESKLPYIMFYREGMLEKDSRGYMEFIERTRKFGRFIGDKVIVLNSNIKHAFLEAGFINSKNIVVGGALRMDPFLKELKKTPKFQRKGQFLLFYFQYNSSWFGKTPSERGNKTFPYAYKVWANRIKLFNDLHNAIIDLAQEMPAMKFVIRPKKESMKNKSWELFEEILSSRPDYNINNNFLIDYESDTAELIFGSDIICAFQSSVVIESALANKKLIFPLFYNYQKTEIYKNDFLWSKDIQLFEVASSKEDFKKKIRESLVYSDFENTSKIEARSKEFFRKYFNSTEPESLDIYSKTIDYVLKEKNKYKKSHIIS